MLTAAVAVGMWFAIDWPTVLLAAVLAVIAIVAAAKAGEPGKTTGPWISRLNRRVTTVGVAPLAASLVCLTVAGLHHTDAVDVCEAYDRFAQESYSDDGYPMIGDDGKWFDALEDLGKAAAGYRGGEETHEVRERGKAILDVADGTGGSGSFITADQYEADTAIGSLPEMLCYGD